MSRKKKFNKTDISIPEVHNFDHPQDPGIESLINDPIVILPQNIFERTRLSFKKWYGGKIDVITYLCHSQILRFLAKQDAELEVLTICTIYTSVTKFLDYVEMLASALDTVLTAQAINRCLIDGFLSHLSTHGGAITSQRTHYAHTKTLLTCLGRRGIFSLKTDGNDRTFPPNPFPNIRRLTKGETALSPKEKKSTIKALRAAILPIWDDQQPLTSELLSYCLLIVAFHTGRNTTPLREMKSDCLKPHPKDNTYFLVLWKRRGHNTSKVILRSESEGPRALESITSIRFNVERLIRHIIARTEAIREQYPELQDRVWVYLSRSTNHQNTAKLLSQSAIGTAIENLVTTYDLKNDNGEPLKINISRLRKTFASRIYEILDGDIHGVARALGNTRQIADNHYLAPTAESKSKWRFMGDILVNELLTKTIGATYRDTPVAKCSDNNSDSNENSKGICTSFLDCVKCRHLVITGDDLHKLFSFYFRIYRERITVPKQRWNREFAHIPRLIDEHIIAEGIRRGVFKQSQIDDAKALAREAPHPFWNSQIIQSLEVIT